MGGCISCCFGNGFQNRQKVDVGDIEVRFQRLFGRPSEFSDFEIRYRALIRPLCDENDVIEEDRISLNHIHSTCSYKKKGKRSKDSAYDEFSMYEERLRKLRGSSFCERMENVKEKPIKVVRIWKSDEVAWMMLQRRLSVFCTPLW